MTLHLAKPALDAEEVAGLVAETRRYGPAIGSPWLSVVVVAYQEQAPLLALLDQLSAQIAAGAGPAGCELILVDNGLSPEIRAQVAARFAAGDHAVCYVLAAGNLGCSQGRNVGVAHARAAWVAFIDADGAIDATYLAACEAASSAPDVVAVRGRVRPLVPTRGLPSHYDLGEARRVAPISAEGISLWRRAEFVAAGGFEAALAGGEGPVLCYRMTERLGIAPAAFVYEPSLWLWHDYYADERHLRAKLSRYAAARLAIDRRYPLFTTYLAQFARLNAARGLPKASSRASARVMVAWVRARLEAEVAREGEGDDGNDLAAHNTVEVVSWGRGGTYATLPEVLGALRGEAAKAHASGASPTPAVRQAADFILVVPTATALARATLASVVNIFEIAPETDLVLPWIEAPAGAAGDASRLPGEVRDAAWLARSVPTGPWAVRRSALASPAFFELWREGGDVASAWERWLTRRGRVRALRLVDSMVPPRVRRGVWPSRWALLGLRAADRLLALRR
ncbi:MAG: glycosyltransferase family 2 protein [Myxococcales bacterium]|nr:glycosyltransferase family 2 protein [Myxococcales bacterium]